MRELRHQLRRADWCGSWHCRQLAFPNGWFWCAFCRPHPSDRGNRCRAPGGLGQVKIELGLPDLARLVRDVAGVAAHVERGVTAAFFGTFNPGLVAGQAEVCPSVARGRLEQLILVVRRVRIVALHAIAHRRSMNRALDIGSVLVGVAGEAERVGRGRDQLDPGDVFVDPNLVTTGAPHRDRRVHRLAFGLVFVAGDALGGIGVRVQRNRMRGGVQGCRAEQPARCNAATRIHVQLRSCFCTATFRMPPPVEMHEARLPRGPCCVFLHRL